MASGTNKKIKVALICHFSNNSIQKKIKTRKKVNEFSPWISQTIEGIKKYDEIELHIISPHDYLVSDNYFFVDNIYYYFFSIGIPFIHRHWPGFFRYDFWTKYSSNRKKIKKIIKKINPDIIHLYGAENSYYSSSILDLLDYKHIVTIQGFVYKEVTIDDNKVKKYRAKIEKDILSRVNNFGVECSYMIKEIEKINPKANFYWHRIPVNLPVMPGSNKTFDIVFFGRVTKQKGIEDFITAIGLIAVKYPKITVKIIGPIDTYYKNYLSELAISNGCIKNIEFLGFIPTQKELHHIVSAAKIYLFPTYNDTIPGTVVEAMHLNVVVISYNIGGLSTLNESEKTIELLEPGDIEGLVKQTFLLLENEDLRVELQRRAFNYVQQNYNSNRPIKELINIYKELI